MASAVAVAMRQAEALRRLETAASELRERFDLAEVNLAPQHRDADIARAMQLEAVSGLLEQLAERLRPVETSDSPAAIQPAATAEPRVRKRG